MHAERRSSKAMPMDLKDGVGFFLRQLKDYPPIAPEKEEELGKTIVECRERLLELKKLNGKGTLSDKIEEKQLKERFSDARKELVSHFLRYAVKVAKTKRYKGTGFDDLIQIAVEALLKSVNSWDYRKGKFSPHSTPWMDRTINKGHNAMERFLYFPNNFYIKVRQARAISRKTDVIPTPEELASELEISVKTARKVLEEAFISKVSLQELLGARTKKDAPLISIVKDLTAKDPEVLAMAQEQLQVSICQVRAIIARIPSLFTKKVSQRNKAIFCLRYGLVDFERRRLEKIGHLFGLTRARVDQINKHIWVRLEGYLLYKKNIKAGEGEKWLLGEIDRMETLIRLTGQKIQILSEEEQAEIDRFLQQVQ